MNPVRVLKHNDHAKTAKNSSIKPVRTSKNCKQTQDFDETRKSPEGPEAYAKPA